MKKLGIFMLILMISIVGVNAEIDACDHVKDCIKSNYGQEGEFFCDINEDGVINLIDLGMYARNYQTEGWCEEYYQEEEPEPTVINNYYPSNSGSGFSIGAFMHYLSDRTSTVFKGLSELFVLRSEFTEFKKLAAEDYCKLKVDGMDYVGMNTCVAEQYKRYGLN